MRNVSASKAVWKEIESLGPWFHNLHLPGGIETAPNHPYGDFPSFKWRELAGLLPQDLSGWTALDVGCNAGFYSFELARRGAEVTGIDREDLYLDQARWAAARFGLGERVRFERRQVYELACERRRFDLVIFMGLFYHLRYAVLALDTIARLKPRLLVFQTLSMPSGNMPGIASRDLDLDNLDFSNLEQVNALDWPKLAFIEGRFSGDETNWWVPNSAAVVGLLRSAALRIVSRPNTETYICEPTGDPPCCEEEWRAATCLDRPPLS
jgi:tRNA (mo5U34)-methyltransferase